MKRNVHVAMQDTDAMSKLESRSTTRSFAVTANI
jgi:hypothetical protein